MKKFFYILLLALSFTACKNRDTNCLNCQTFIGDFLYMEDIAVLKGDDFIYKLNIDSNTKALEEKVKPIKKEAYEMVEVKLIGVLNKIPNNEEGWQKTLEIKEIISIADKASKTDILIQL